MKAIDKARKVLEQHGYFVENLWSVNDVIDKHGCSIDIARKVLKELLTKSIETINEMIQDHEVYPMEVTNILNTWDENEDPYRECERIVKELNKINWSADWYLDGVLYNIRKL